MSINSIIQTIQTESNLKLNKMGPYTTHYLDYLNAIDLVEMERVTIDVTKNWYVQ